MPPPMPMLPKPLLPQPLTLFHCHHLLARPNLTLPVHGSHLPLLAIHNAQGTNLHVALTLARARYGLHKPYPAVMGAQL